MINRLKNRLLVLTLTFVFGEACLSKLFGGGVPDWFIKQFTGTILDLGGPSLIAAYWMIAVLETITTILLLTALLRDEVAKPAKRVLPAALLMAQLTFFALMIGLRISHQYDQAFQDFAYSVLTFIVTRSLLTDETNEPNRVT